MDSCRDITDSADQIVISIEGVQFFGLWSDIKSVVPKDAKAILRVHNIESAYHHSVAAESRGFLKLTHQMSSLQYHRLENRLLTDVRYCYAISETEAEAEALVSQDSLAADKALLVLPISAVDPCEDKGKSRYMTFVLSYFDDLTLPNNHVCLRWFCDNVLQRLDGDKVGLQVAEKSGGQFYVYERVPVCDSVGDIDAILCQSKTVVTTIFSGAGVKIKVLDALYYAKSLITNQKDSWEISKLVFPVRNHTFKFQKYVQYYISTVIYLFNRRFNLATLPMSLLCAASILCHDPSNGSAQRNHRTIKKFYVNPIMRNRWCAN